jgi:catechol 2,3-dioxygenase-like lactoylglutathione lyase family enzyme
MPAKTELKITTLSYVIIYVNDTSKSVPFYRDILGLPLRFEEQGWVEFETGAVTVALHNNDKKVESSGHGPVPVFSVDNIYEAYDALKTKGVKFDKELQVVCEGENGKVGKSGDFRDPDGNRLSIFGYTNK